MASTLLTSAQDIFRKDDSFAGYKDIVAEFPPGSRLISARPLGISTWTNTTRLSVEHPDGKEKVYFLKCAQSEDGRVLVQGEFNSMSEIYATAPGFVPKPYTWGTCYLDDTEAYFFISEFIDFSSRLSKFDRICRKLADLHQTSVSPTGKFGFHVTTSQSVPWERSWTVFSSKLLAHVVSLDAVVPRLIGVLGRDGRKVKPCLIHGDLWEGNTGTSLETGDIYVFDSAAFYAHNEMETGNWRCHYNNLRDPLYTQTYLSLVPPSDPRDIWDDRNCLYSVYYTVIYSVNHRCQGTAVRQTYVSPFNLSLI
ncbi:putative kinase [Aspergillus oryzae 100-8]|uniref:protein-ribulosamine 3-kinase n=1 Tax=Aspergillus oryzae (strain 3.042) TaxID=1160506 RepID=I8TPT5_ASPO3|nr:putative kinase [Aspergillus oryzae 3.042]KDE76311.1 putative kinase [Aspergillus oryzae 100-8]|eukprot:EIT75958.1 putative kinase [Aspergillus oryzae 3.042]